VKTTISLILVLFFAASVSAAADVSFNVKVPDLKGKQAKAVLTFNDTDKLVEVRSSKRQPVDIPYAAIDKASYQYTNERTPALTEEKIHWLEIDYHDQDAHKVLVVRMKGREHIAILDALKAHTGIDAEILGNADKRRGHKF
jgi:hypothetical protein